METSNSNNHEKPTELKVGLVIICRICNHRRIISDWWLEKIKEKRISIDFATIQSNLVCSCGKKGQAELTLPRLSKADVLHFYRLLRLGEVDVRQFAKEMEILANEGNFFAERWLKVSLINKSLKKQDEKEKARRERINSGGNYNTKQWLDWETGISGRQGKRNRMYK